MLPTSFLKHVVHLSSFPLEESFSRLLSDSLDGFLANQRAPRGRAAGHALSAPQLSPADNAGHAGDAGHAAGLAPTPAAVVAAAKEGEMDRLRAEVSESQALLRQLLEQGVDKKSRGARARKKSAR